MSTKSTDLGGDLPPKTDALYASLHRFISAEVKQKTQQLMQTVTNKVSFNGDVLKNSEELSDAFVNHLEVLAKYSEFLNTNDNDPDKILFHENGEKRENLEFLLLNKVVWINKLETTIRQVSQDSGFPLPAKLSHDDLDKWLVHMSTQLYNGGTTEENENVLQEEGAVNTLSFKGSVPTDISTSESFNISEPPLGETGVLNEVSHDSLGREVLPELQPLQPLGEHVTSHHSLMEESSMSLEIAQLLPGDPSTSSAVNGSEESKVKRRSLRLEVYGRASTSTIPIKQKGKFADVGSVQHGRDTAKLLSCICGFEATEQRSLNEHLNKLTMEWKYRCDICGWYFFEYRQREQHNRKSCKPYQNNSASVATSCRKTTKKRRRDLQRQGRSQRKGNSTKALVKESANCKSVQPFPDANNICNASESSPKRLLPVRPPNELSAQYLRIAKSLEVFPGTNVSENVDGWVESLSGVDAVSSEKDPGHVNSQQNINCNVNEPDICASTRLPSIAPINAHIKVETFTAPDNQEQGSSCTGTDQPHESVRVKVDDVEQNASKSSEIPTITISDEEL